MHNKSFKETLKANNKLTWTVKIPFQKACSTCFVPDFVYKKIAYFQSNLNCPSDVAYAIAALYCRRGVKRHLTDGILVFCVKRKCASME